MTAPTRLDHAPPALDAGRAAAIAEMVLAAVHREFPVHIVHLVRGPEDVRSPRELTPSFYGCFDWHSAVHGHWSLVRLARRFPDVPWRPRLLAALAVSFAPERLAGECAYLGAEGRQGFERPYGLAWLLQLAAELREWTRGSGAGEPAAAAVRGWRSAIEPLEALAAERMAGMLARLPRPVRTGEHGQTAFALGLTYDWAGEAGREDVARAIATAAQRYYAADRDAPIAYEPSGYDFLSPALAEADLMRRVWDRERFADWLAGFLPDPAGAVARAWLAPVVSPDPADGKLSHLDGLNLSRAWMLDGIVSALPDAHPWRRPLAEAITRHAEAGLASVPSEHYAGAHWLGSFALYLLTRRGAAGRSPGA